MSVMFDSNWLICLNSCRLIEEFVVVYEVWFDASLDEDQAHV